MSYDLFLYAAPEGVDPDDHLDELMEAGEPPRIGVAGACATEMLRALPDDLRPTAEQFDEVVVLAGGVATVDFSGGYGCLEVSYGVPLPPDQFLAMVEGVGEACATIGHDLVHDPQLGENVRLGDPDTRAAMIGKWGEGVALVAELREQADAEAGHGRRSKPRWWQRRR